MIPLCDWCQKELPDEERVECGGCEMHMHRLCATYDIVIRDHEPYVYFFCKACNDS